MSAVDDILDYLGGKRKGYDREIVSNDKLSKSAPPETLDKAGSDKVTSSTWEKLKGGPMGRLGENFVASQVATQGHKIMGSVTSTVTSKVTGPFMKTVESVKNSVFNSIALAMTAQDQMAMFFLQQTGKEAIKALKKKKERLLELQENCRLLHNALVRLTSSPSFFTKYLRRIREALITLSQAEDDLRRVTSSLSVNEVWLSNRFKAAQDNMEKALELLEPPKVSKGKPLTSGGLLSNIKIPPEAEQLMAILELPKLCKEVTLAASGYFLATLKANALILSFTLGWQQLVDASGNFMQQYTLSTLSSLLEQLGELIDDMSLTVNGDEGAALGPVPGYEPDTIKTSAKTLEWSLRLRVIFEYTKLVPGQSLDITNSNQQAVKLYNDVVAKIQSFDNWSEGGAVLTATDGREEPGQLEKQLVSFVLGAMQSIVDKATASSILSISRVIQTRLDLSIRRDQMIIDEITRFTSFELGFSNQLAKLGKTIDKMLRNTGMDRAADFLKQGKFSSFFSMNAKTATYAGAAMVGLSLLKECLDTSEDRAKLDAAQLEATRDNKAKQLLARRTVGLGYTLQNEDLNRKDKRFSILEDNVNRTADVLKSKGKCDIPDDFKPTAITKNLSSVLGISIFGSGAVQSNLTKYGKGIL